MLIDELERFNPWWKTGAVPPERAPPQRLLLPKSDQRSSHACTIACRIFTKKFRNMILRIMFLNREDELDQFRRWRDSGRAELIILYGRRRVGKTSLIRRLLEDGDAPSAYLIVSRLDRGGILDDFSTTLVERGLVKHKPELRGFGELYRLIGDLSSEKRLIVAIDEFQRLADADPSSLTLLQAAWDDYLCKGKLMLLLSGSAVGAVERIGMSYSSPLYGRRTGQMKLMPLPYRHAKKFLTGYSLEDRVRAYAVFGGTPAYLSQIDPMRPLLDSIRDRLLLRSSPLFEEPNTLLAQETREPLRYMAMLEAMSYGASTLGEISDKAGVSSNDLPKYMNTLVGELDIVGKRYPLLEEGKRGRTRYFISDNFFRSWFRFVKRNLPALEMGSSDSVARKVEGELDEYTSLAFEDICMEHLRWMIARGRIHATDAGRWWNSHTELDGVALDQNGGTAHFIEAKWSRVPVGRDVLNDLIRKSEAFPEALP